MKYSLILTAALCLMVLTGCGRSGQPLKTGTYRFDDSTSRADLTFVLELPETDKGTAGIIRRGLVDIMDSQLAYIASYEGKRLFPEYDGNFSDTDALIEYYRSNALEALDFSANADFEERKSYILEDPDMNDAEKARMLDYVPRYEYDFSLTKEYETDRYAVFSSMDYVYLGGAHGGVNGQGSVTFDKRNGRRFKDFIKPDALEPMQDLLVKGLTEYFADNAGSVTEDNVREFLFLDSDNIPLPAWSPAPTEEGLCFTYKQYEIAAYASGMPSFVIPYDEVKPFLTDEARNLLNLK
ncbi:MAG: DUF3298 domain-containing protein [Bacteroidales bacterium]|nr:DUF3298 domain-containing protein [Bacteroidales bacterium]